MKKDKNFISDLISRYIILILVAIPNLYLFYLIFTPLTIYLTFALSSLFYGVVLQGNILIINEVQIELIEACVAGSAYYLLFFLNLSVPEIKIEKRIKMLLFAFSSFLVINITRIFVLIVIYFRFGESTFSVIHKVFWYVLSTILVLGIWFLEVKIFKIKGIPVISDLKKLYNKSLLKK